MKTTILLTLMVLTFGCTCQKTGSKSHGNFSEISFGSGGGFTGMQSTYLLKSDRKVYKSEKGEYQNINKISRSEIRKISGTISKMDFYNLKYSETGNMNYFIEVKGADAHNKVIWSDNSVTPELKEFYKTLTNTLKP